MKKICLTGIKPTGLAHIGNYFGAIKPAIDLSKKTGENISYYFIADHHALNQIHDPKLLNNYIYSVAATWIACGLDPKEVVFYRQSEIKETFELYSILCAVTPKGLINRCHAYKAVVDKNMAEGKDGDSDVNMGLFNYPVLMAADILLFNSNFVPVGVDQKQHVEVARDIAVSFNATYGKTLTLPEALLQENLCKINGSDGRKMSKSYNNQLSLFASDDEIKKYVAKITTDSSLPTEPKPTCHTIFELFNLVANVDECAALRKRFEGGISWADAKKELTTALQKFIKPIREKYDYYMNNKDILDKLLKEGAEKAKPFAVQTIDRVKKAVGLDR